MLAKYYRLNEKKQMLDLSAIQAGQILLFIQNEDDMMFVEACMSDDEKKYFWVTEKEVTFVEEKEENWTEERKQEIEKIVNKKWLEL
jgi:hypothetical protein